MDKQEDKTLLVHSFESQHKSPSSMKVLVIAAIVVLLGTGTGFLLSKTSGASSTTVSSLPAGKSPEKGVTVGSDDLKTFKDTAEGKLEEGGIEGEGQYHLVRPGGQSQYVYLTSSIVDLSQFSGKKIKVWGQTHSAEKAGWLMDVGRVEVLE